MPVLTDIHGNAEGLERVLHFLKQHAIVSPPLVLGDLIWHAHPAYDAVAALDLLMALPLRGIVSGNTDRWFVDGELERRSARGGSEADVDERMLRLKASLGPRRLAFLRDLPERIEVQLGAARCMAAHASPTSLYRGLDLDLDDAELTARVGDVRFEYLITGHLHRAFSRPLRSATHLSVGPVGRHPEEYSGIVEFALLDPVPGGMIFLPLSLYAPARGSAGVL